MHLRDFAQPGHQAVVVPILHATVLDEEREMPKIVRALEPAILIAVGRERKRALGRQIPTEISVEGFP